MLWEACLLFSPIRMSAGQYHGRGSTKNSNRPILKLPLRSNKPIEIGQILVKAVAHALDAIERNPAHRRQPRNCRRLHIHKAAP